MKEKSIEGFSMYFAVFLQYFVINSMKDGGQKVYFFLIICLTIILLFFLVYLWYPVITESLHLYYCTSSLILVYRGLLQHH